MKWINRIKSKAAIDRHAEEILYEAAYKEVDSGRRRVGLWAKALAKANGAEESAQSIYIKLLVQKYKDEYHLKEEIMKEVFEEHARQQQQTQFKTAAQQKDPSKHSTTLQEDKEMWEPALSGNALFWGVIAFIGGIIGLLITF